MGSSPHTRVPSPRVLPRGGAAGSSGIRCAAATSRGCCWRPRQDEQTVVRSLAACAAPRFASIADGSRRLAAYRWAGWARDGAFLALIPPFTNAPSCHGLFNAGHARRAFLRVRCCSSARRRYRLRRAAGPVAPFNAWRRAACCLFGAKTCRCAVLGCALLLRKQRASGTTMHLLKQTNSPANG